MIDERSEEQASLYVLGALSADEMAAFEGELDRDSELRALVSELEEATLALVNSLPQKAPPPELRSRLLSEIRRGNLTETPVRRGSSWLPWAAAAAFAVLAGVLGFDRMAVQRQLAELREQDHLSRIRIATLTAQVGAAPGSSGTVAWDEQKQRGTLALSKLPPLGPDEDYQLWVIDPNKPQPVSAGVIRIDETGTTKVTFIVEVPLQHAGKFAISRERKGGVEGAPQGPIVLAGE